MVFIFTHTGIYILVYVLWWISRYILQSSHRWYGYVPCFLCSQQPRHYTTWKKPQFPVAPPPEEHEEDEEMEEAKAWTTEALTYPTLKCWKSAHFFFWGGEDFVYIFLVMFAYFFEKYMYTMYGRFLRSLEDFWEHVPRTFSGWWFQTFVIFIPICGRFPFWRPYFFKWGWFNHQPVFMYHHDRLKNDSTNLIAMWGIQPLKFPSANYSITEGEKSTPED